MISALVPVRRAGWSRVAVHPVVRILRRLVGLLLWRPLVAILGPLRVEATGPLPAGPVVVVADHTSHADAVLIRLALARLGRHRVVSAAAEDHWFTGRRRAWAAILGAGGFPFPRTGDSGLDRAARLLADGYDVIVFPQGSRAAEAEGWHCGAARVAASVGVPLLPVRLFGAALVLPRGARRLSPHPISVTVGTPLPTRCVEPLHPGASHPTPQRGEGRVLTDAARDAARALPVAAPVEGGLVRLSAGLRTNATRRGALLLAVWAFTEATVWPLIPDLLLAGLVFAVPRLAPRLVAVAAGASAVGGAAALTLGRTGLSWPLLAVTPGMQQQAVDAVSQHGARGLLAQPLSGVPYKAFNIAGAGMDVDVLSWMAWTVTGRGLRMAVVALVAWAAGRLLWSARVPEGWAPRIHALVVLTGLALFVLGWTAVLLWWR